MSLHEFLDEERGSVTDQLGRADVFARVWAVGMALGAASKILDKAASLGVVKKTETDGSVDYGWTASFLAMQRFPVAECHLAKVDGKYQLEALCSIGEMSGRVRIVCDRNLIRPPHERLRVLGILPGEVTMPAFHRNGNGIEKTELSFAEGMVCGFLREVKLWLVGATKTEEKDSY